MLVSRHRNARQIHDINVADRFFENVAQIKYLVAKVTNQNLFRRNLKED
jgi:hypothetical protein